MAPTADTERPAQEDEWTVGRLLTWTTDFLKARGADSPRLDAEVLLAHVMACARIKLYTAFHESPGAEQRAAFRDLVKRCAAGTPVAYLVGEKEFYSLPFRVTPDVLIPRPETEHLVVRMLDLIDGLAGRQETVRVADVGTGSGIIAICAALRSPNAQVTAIDKSPAALLVAQENAARHNAGERIEFVESDLFDEVQDGAPFDVIASNPPYITTAEMQALPREVSEHEPRMALDGGPNGDDIIARLIAQSEKRLKPGGWLLIEISPMLQKRVEAILDVNSSWERSPTLRDLAGHARVIVAKRAA